MREMESVEMTEVGKGSEVGDGVAVWTGLVLVDVPLGL
mgnify:CR=1 FL=1